MITFTKEEACRVHQPDGDTTVVTLRVETVMSIEYYLMDAVSLTF